MYCLYVREFGEEAAKWLAAEHGFCPATGKPSAKLR